MAELNLNFHEQAGRHHPTKDEIVQIESAAVSVEAIIKMLATYAEYANDDSGDMGGVCISVCNAMELLMRPVIEYFECAGDAPAEGSA